MALRGTLSRAGGWSTRTRSRAPTGRASSASLVRTKVNGHTSPVRSSTSPGDDAVGGEDEAGEVGMVDGTGGVGRVAVGDQAPRTADRGSVHDPVGRRHGRAGRGRVVADEVEDRHVQTSTASAVRAR